jgi:hypothetical protein
MQQIVMDSYVECLEFKLSLLSAGKFTLERPIRQHIRQSTNGKDFGHDYCDSSTFDINLISNVEESQ